MKRYAQRLEDRGQSFHVRPVVIGLGGERVAIDPQEAQLLLLELGRLPGNRHLVAEEAATEIVAALAAGHVVEFDDEHRRCLIRAIEGVRIRSGLRHGLARLRELLLHAPDPVL